MAESLVPCEHYFGSHVAMDAGLLVVSSPRSGKHGELVIYRRAKGAWTLEARLDAAGSEAHAATDWSLALSAERIALASPWLPRSGFPAGVVLLYEKRAGKWQRVEALTRPVAGVNDLGYSVALLRDTMVVSGTEGATRETSARVVLVFARKHNQWVEVQRISPPKPDPTFGDTLGLSPTHLAIGAPGEADGQGTVYLYDKGPDGYRAMQVFSKQGEEYSAYGGRLALSRDTLVIGALSPNELTLYALRGRQWREREHISLSEQATERDSLAIVGPQLLLVGAPEDESGVFYDLSKPANKRAGWFQENFEVDDPPDPERRGYAVAAGRFGVAIGAPESWGRSGAVYMLEREGGEWMVLDTLRPPCAKQDG